MNESRFRPSIADHYIGHGKCICGPRLKPLYQILPGELFAPKLCRECFRKKEKHGTDRSES